MNYSKKADIIQNTVYNLFDNIAVNGRKLVIGSGEPLEWKTTDYPSHLFVEKVEPKLRMIGSPIMFGNSISGFGGSIMHDYDRISAVASTLVGKPLLSNLGKLDLPEFEVKFTDEDKRKQQILEKYRGGIGLYKQLQQAAPPVDYSRILKNMQQELDNIKVNGAKFETN